jgi:hypothetical protein
MSCTTRASESPTLMVTSPSPREGRSGGLQWGGVRHAVV